MPSEIYIPISIELMEDSVIDWFGEIIEVERLARLQWFRDHGILDPELWEYDKQQVIELRKRLEILNAKYSRGNYRIRTLRKNQETY